MKTISINTNSWHYKIASKFNKVFYPGRDEIDTGLCSYIITVLFGCLMILAVLCFAAIAGNMLIVDPVRFAMSGFDFYYLYHNAPLYISIAVWGTIIVAYVYSKIDDYRCNLDTSKNNWYSIFNSFFNKICIKVEFK